MVDTLVILQDFGFGWSEFNPLMRLRKNSSNPLRLTPVTELPIDQTTANWNRPCRHSVICRHSTTVQLQYTSRELQNSNKGKKCKGSPYSIRALGSELNPVIGRAGTKLYRLVTKAHGCEQLAQSRYLIMQRPVVEPATSRSRVRHANHYTTKLPLKIAILGSGYNTQDCYMMVQLEESNKQTVHEPDGKPMSCEIWRTAKFACTRR